MSKRRRQPNVAPLGAALSWVITQHHHHQQRRDQQIQFQQQQELLRQQSFYRQELLRQQNVYRQQQEIRWQQGMRAWLAGIQSADELHERLSPTTFEKVIADTLKAAGYRDVKQTGGSGDRGVDICGQTPVGEKVVVQCKCYAPGNTVKSPEVQQFIGMANVVHRAQVAIFVTTSSFTAEARSIGLNASRQLHFYLMDGPTLIQWIRSIYTHYDGTGIHATPEQIATASPAAQGASSAARTLN